MAFWNKWFGKEPEPIVESTKAFQGKGNDNVSDKFIDTMKGEGVDDVLYLGFGKESAGNFNNFYNEFINTTFQNKRMKVANYRIMAEMPEISSIIEDISIESTQEDYDGKILKLEILDDDIKSNDNIVNNLEAEFDDLFHNKIRINENIIDYVRTYFIDAEIFIEKVIQKGKASRGIVRLKKLPTETMDAFINPSNGKTEWYYQVLATDVKPPKSLEEAERDDKIIVFFPEQIAHIDYGIYQATKRNVQGYLEKAKQPFNQLKLLETSVVIYRIIKAPSRLVFKIDTGAMPRDKSLKFVEKIKKNLTQKVEFDTKSGQMRNQTDVMSMMDNYFLPQCLQLTNTRISTLRGTDKTLKQIIDDFNNGIKNEMLSVDQKTGRIIIGEVEWAGVTRKDAKFVRVHIDNNEFLDCTPDHRFVMRDGTEVQAQHLKPNDSLMPCYTRNHKMASNVNEYRQVFDNESQEWKYIHRIACPTKDGNVVHHKDFDRFNNMSDNLVEMSSDDHFHYHSTLSQSKMKKNWENPEFRVMMVAKAKETAKKRWSNPENRKRQGEKLKRLWVEQKDVFMEGVNKPKSDKHKESLRTSITDKWKNDSEYINKFNTFITVECFDRVKVLYNQNVGVDVTYLARTLSSDNSFMDMWNNTNKNKRVSKNNITPYMLKKIIKSMGYDSYTEFKSKAVNNHKVVRVEWLDIVEDAGCLTIKDPGNNHNFALSCGVFVKNSSDGRGSSVEELGGDPSGFAQLDDIYYFARKLYIALKYPISRVINQENRTPGDTLFMGGNSNEITIDEIRWAKFLERHQQKFCTMFTDMFMLHLEFKGLKAEYDVDINKINVVMTPPNNYKQQMFQMTMEKQIANYTSLNSMEEFSKVFLMREYLKWSEDMIKQNAEGLIEDKKLFPKPEGF